MSIRRTTTLAIVAAALLVVAGCEKQSSGDEPEAEAETAEEKAPAQPEQGAEDGEEKKDEKASKSKSPTSLDELPEDVNAVQNEMQKLNTAMQNTLTLIANDSLAGIPGQIKKVHPARQLTAKALEKGKYKPPVNGDDIEKFKKLDEEFHKDLKGLLKASKEDDLQKATEQYGKLVDGCTNCHTQFRFE